MKEKDKKQPQRNLTGTMVNEKSVIQILMPHFVAAAVFATITFLFFSPMLVDNKSVNQSDIVQVRGAAKEILDYRNQTGKEALWTNSMFGGMPAFQITVDYKGNLIRYLDKIGSLGFPHPSQLLFLAFVCFYILLLVIGVNPWLCIGGAIAYALSSYDLIILEVGHNSKMHSIALIPLVVAGVLLMSKKKYLWGGILSAIGLSLLVYANHLQITFYLLLMMMVFAIVEIIYAIREKELIKIVMMGAIVIAAGLFAVSSNLSLLWSTYDYVPSTIRGPSELTSNTQSTGGLDMDYAFAWSYGKMETFTLMIPNFYGGSSGSIIGENSNFAKLLQQANLPLSQRKQYLSSAPTYWGDQQFTSGPVYVGAIVCFLFVLGMFLLKDRWKWWLLSASMLAIFLAWGRNFHAFNDLMFHYFPGYNKFRTVSMALVIVQFTFPFMALITLSKILKGEFEMKELIAKLKYSVYITGGLCLLFAVAGGSFFNFTGPSDARMQREVVEAMISDRKSMLQMDSFRSLIFILLSAGIIWAFVNERVKKNIFIGVISLLVFADMFFVGKRYLNEDDFVSKNEFSKYFEKSPADELILKETSKDYRVLNLSANTFNDAQTSFNHKSVGGYHAAKLRRYQEIIEHQLMQDSTRKSQYPFNKSVVDMLNTKYIIFKAGQQDQVLPNVDACNNAWFVSEVKIVNNADEEMKALNSFNPDVTAIVDKRFANQITGLTATTDSTASIQLENYEPNHLVYNSRSSKENIAVFSEIYYQPGWNAYVDGKKTDHFRCDYILRGMKLPAGEHTVEFKFEPVSFFTGEKVAMASSGLLLLIAAGAIVLAYNRRKKEETVA
ncbi:MAG: YfhO family protein [Chitinophagales bacterium]|nr:YfhO family protein [Chitinophagales bacterium]